MGKITKTFSIDTNIFKEFQKIATKNKLNKSSYIEEQIKEYMLSDIDMESTYYFKEPIIEIDNRNIGEKAEDMKNDYWKKGKTFIINVDEISEEDAKISVKELMLKYNEDVEWVDEESLKITDKKFIKSDIFVELSNGNRLKYVDFLRTYEKCVDPDEFLNPSNTISFEEKTFLIKFPYSMNVDLKENETYTLKTKHKNLSYTNSYQISFVGKSRIDGSFIFKINESFFNPIFEHNSGVTYELRDCIEYIGLFSFDNFDTKDKLFDFGLDLVIEKIIMKYPN
jgi:hypothetical protein